MSDTVLSNHFTAANATEHARNGHIARRAKSPRKAYDQAIQLQQLILRDAIDHSELAQSDEKDMRALAKPTDMAALARAWCDLEETKRKLKMRPLPKSVDVTSPKRKVKDPVSFTPAPEPAADTTANSGPAIASDNTSTSPS